MQLKIWISCFQTTYHLMPPVCRASKKAGMLSYLKPHVSLCSYLDKRSHPRSTQHCHLAGIDAVGTIFTCMVHAQHSVQHLLLLTVARGWDHTVSTWAQLQGHCYSSGTQRAGNYYMVISRTLRLKVCPFSATSSICLEFQALAVQLKMNKMSQAFGENCTTCFL